MIKTHYYWLKSVKYCRYRSDLAKIKQFCNFQPISGLICHCVTLASRAAEPSTINSRWSNTFRGKWETLFIDAVSKQSLLPHFSPAFTPYTVENFALIHPFLFDYFSQIIILWFKKNHSKYSEAAGSLFFNSLRKKEEKNKATIFVTKIKLILQSNLVIRNVLIRNKLVLRNHFP